MSASSPTETEGAPAGPSYSTPNSLRLITSRRSLPGSRAIAGGILIAVAVLGTYAAIAQANKNDLRAVVVANHDIAPGTRLEAQDFRVVRIELSADVATHTLQSTKGLAGATLLGPLKSGEIAQVGQITKAQAAAYVETSFAIPSSRALDGTLQLGETVDILVTDKNATTSTSTARVAASSAHILRTQSQNNGSIGHSGDITITVGLTSREQAAGVAAAVDQGQITLVRTTGLTS